MDKNIALENSVGSKYDLFSSYLFNLLYSDEPDCYVCWERKMTCVLKNLCACSHLRLIAYRC